MKISIAGDKTTGWELLNGGWEPIGVVENVDYLQAINVFAANWPEHAAELDKLRDDYVDVVGVPAVEIRQKKSTAARQRGSGARFRELILAGKSNQECLDIVRAEFSDSKATLSDAAWHRAQIRKG